MSEEEFDLKVGEALTAADLEGKEIHKIELDDVAGGISLAVIGGSSKANALRLRRLTDQLNKNKFTGAMFW